MAPPPEVIALGGWTGGSRALDIVFSDQLAAVQGNSRSVAYVDFVCLNTNYRDSDDFPTHSQRVWVSDPNAVFNALPKYLQNEFCLPDHERTSDFFERGKKFLAERDRHLPADYPRLQFDRSAGKLRRISGS